MVTQDMLLRYFYKQNRRLSLDNLFDKFGFDDAILTPINYLVNYDWLEELDSTTWQITADGKLEYEQRERAQSHQSGNFITISGHGNVINTGVIEGDLRANIKNLNETGLTEVSKHFESLTDLVKGSSEIQEAQKAEYLQTLTVLSEEALKPKEKRLPTLTLKQIIQFGLGTLNAFSSISTITGTTIKDIADYFLS